MRESSVKREREKEERKERLAAATAAVTTKGTQTLGLEFYDMKWQRNEKQQQFTSKHYAAFQS